MKRYFPLWLVLALTLSFLHLPTFAAEQLVVLHTNDIHGQSLAQLASLIAKEREQHQSVLLLDAGDLFSGTAVSSLFQGKAEQESILALNYDALAIGNHDFDFGQEVLIESINKGVPWLAANIYAGENPLAQPFLIKELEGVRVLIVGLTSTATPKMAFPENVAGLDFRDPVPILKSILAEQAGNFDICLVVSHLGYGEDLLLAQRVPGITAIIGGHSHTVLASPVRIRDTLITQTGSSAQHLGKVVIQLTEGYPATGELIRVERDTPKHPLISAIDEHYAQLMEEEMGQILGYASQDYFKRGLGYFLVEALLQASGADAALYNSAGVRAGLTAGPITQEDLFAVEPFDNQAVIVTLSGADFAELLELRSRRSSDFYSGPRLVDVERAYTIATSDFLTSDTSSYNVLSKGEIKHLGKSIREVLGAYLKDSVLQQALPQAE